MDEPKDSGSTATSNETATGKAAEDADANASTDDISPIASHLGHEAEIDMNRRKQKFISIDDRDGATAEVNVPEDVRQSREGPAAHVASSGLGESSLNDQRSSAAETDEEGVPGNSTLYHSVAVSEKDTYSPPPSSPSLKSSENSYRSFDPLIDEPPGKTDHRRYDTDPEETDDEKYQKNIDKGKGKEVAERVPDPGPVPPAEAQQSQPLNNVPWVQDPERPPQKFPIRFIDCVGRSFVWPWKKAQTWKGAKRLVESAFLYVDVLGPHVFAGHYDLTIQEMWSDPKTAAISPTLASYPPATTQPSSSNWDIPTELSARINQATKWTVGYRRPQGDRAAVGISSADGVA
ncbi:hypothetical protein VMCG_07669 [Cytospora schulzeri]|uniref:Ubiquitin-like domain-containing protein n=1 Tax=Cytospora schulzeri TaxID=448051 RepID=A0A423VZ40_9PEZI|nr:hypothetical protein VMCG_07669 [Valsa malicola]